MNMPTLKINKFRSINSLPTIDQFTQRTADDVAVHLTVKEDAGQKFFLIGSTFQVVGWTDNVDTAFQFFLNIGAYTFAESYEAARGKKLN